MSSPIPSPFPRPTPKEVLRLHSEFQIWMRFGNYKLQSMDNMPLWRLRNTSMVLSTGAGVGAYFTLGHFSRSSRFPFGLVSSIATFFVVHHLTYASQLRGLYDTFLSLPSPLGEKARRILTDLREESGHLPSEEYASQLALQSPQRGGQHALGEPGASAFAPTAAERGFGAGSSPPERSEPVPDSGLDWAARDDPPPALAESWDSTVAGPGGDLTPWDDAGWSQPAGPAREGPTSRKGPARPATSTTSWDEIRARSAAGR